MRGARTRYISVTTITLFAIATIPKPTHITFAHITPWRVGAHGMLVACVDIIVGRCRRAFIHIDACLFRGVRHIGFEPHQTFTYI